LSNPLGIEYATGTIYTALHEVQPKVFDKVSVSKRRFWPGRYSTQETFRIKIGSVFLCYFLLQSQKKVEQFDASKRCDEDARKFGPLCSPCPDGQASIKLVDVSILFPTG
jgi:hypothetical protein